MRKSGLQKQITSIFDGEPISKTVSTSAALESEMDDSTVEAAILAVDDIPGTEETKPSLGQRLAQVQSEAVHTPTMSVMRPKPLTKKSVDSSQKKSASAALRGRKNIQASGKTKMDPHQKKMTIMVGVLSVVFGIVLFISLGGLGQSSVTAANSKDTPEAGSEIAASKPPLQWQSPQPLPEMLRDPMEPVQQEQSLSVEPEVVDPVSDPEQDPLIVKGIVYSKVSPSAIINDQIVLQGESVNGVKVLKINKETVEFEKDGQIWEQTVQR